MISSAVRKKVSVRWSFCEKSVIVLVERIKNNTSFIVVRVGNQMWSIVVFEVATECTEVKFTLQPAILAKWKKSQNLWQRNLSISRSHYPERASALDFKDTSAPRFGHSDVVFDIFLETRFLHLIALLSNLCKLFWPFRYHFTNMVWLHVKNTTNSVY